MRVLRVTQELVGSRFEVRPFVCEVASGPARGPAVGAERLHPAVDQPGPDRRPVAGGGDEQLLVVAQQRHQPATPRQGDQLLQDAAAVGPPVDVVPERDQGVLRAGANSFQQSGQGRRAPVDITHCDRASQHADSGGEVRPICREGRPPNSGILRMASRGRAGHNRGRTRGTEAGWATASGSRVSFPRYSRRPPGPGNTPGGPRLRPGPAAGGPLPPPSGPAAPAPRP